MHLEKEYAAKPQEYYEYAREDILDLLPSQIQKIADIGGSSGATLSAIKAIRPSAQTICIDAHAPALAIAASRGHQAIACDLEHELPAIVSECDVVLLLDILEHLVDPWRVLAELVRRLPSRATVVVSLPNVRFWPVSSDLMFRGAWRLQESGVLDRTHLRFFTRQSGAELLTQSGLVLQSTTGRVHGARRYALLNHATFGLFEDLFCSQYLYVGRTV